jgi:glycosyltransferase involved in cell wall biosynthesis
MISITIPTYNNLDYLKCTIDSIKKNSLLNNFEILLHINEGSDGTLEYAKKFNYRHTYSEKNIGLCSAINKISKIAKHDYLLYSHDDMYFCPGWDKVLEREIKLLKNNLFYLSATMIEVNSAHISFNCGSSLFEFDEEKLLNNFRKLSFYDHQGSHFAPHLVHRKIWDKVGGFSEEYNPGMGSDPDFNMKLWNEGIRVFKGINDFRVYHFSSITTRKKTGLIKNKGDITFLKKWGFSTKFFKKYFLRSRSLYKGELSNPNKNFFYFFELFLCKIKKFYINILNY